MESEMVQPCAPTVVRRVREIRRGRDSHIRAARRPRLALRPRLFPVESQPPQQPAPVGARLREVGDPDLDVVDSRHPSIKPPADVAPRGYPDRMNADAATAPELR